MGSGKGQTKRINTRSSNNSIDPLVHTMRYEADASSYVNIHSWNDWVYNNDLKEETWWSYYLKEPAQSFPSRKRKNKKSGTNEQISYVLTETMRDVIANNLFYRDEDNEELIKSVDYLDYEIKYERSNKDYFTLQLIRVSDNTLIVDYPDKRDAFFPDLSQNLRTKTGYYDPHCPLAIVRYLLAHASYTADSQ